MIKGSTKVKKVYDFTSPMDGIERALSLASFSWERLSDDEIKSYMSGRWNDYTLFFEYFDDTDSLQLSCWPEGIFVGDTDLKEVAEFLVRVNEQLWIGHFAWDEEAGTVVYRHTFLAHEVHHLEPAVLADVLDAARLAFDRFQPFFQMLVTGDVGLEQSLNVAYMDTVGEA